jgi:enoyl-[acyl-carrier protein] reductase I
MGFLSGKRILITGLLSNRSIAYGIAKACHREGAELAFTYVGDRFKERTVDFANEFNSKLIFDCDVGERRTNCSPIYRSGQNLAPV